MLSPGTRLGPYEIQSPIGAGGMGEVYRARDTRLDRTVAIKVLGQEVSARPEVRARFEREARAVSSLSHPHICTLFDVGREGGRDFLVMEHLEGETLGQRLARGALPVQEALKLGIEIADALDAAHSHGVIHRDLKPGNIMLTKGGAKLLDFGLARVAAPAPGVSGLTESPTMSQPLTGEGTIVGTLQYMAPEQLEGKEADARTDIFAFGAVLYEMVTGTRAFEAKSRASMIAAIMEREPPPISSVTPLAPPALDRVTKRCLAKHPDDRWQTARDLKHELDWVREDSSSSGARAVAAPPATAAPARRGAWLRNAGVAVGAIGALVLAIRLFQPGVPKLNPAMSVRTLQLPFPQFRYPGMSPDGKWIALPATDAKGTWGLYFMNVNGGEPRLIVTDTSFFANYADISPDGSQIVYEGGAPSHPELRVVPVLGGASRTVAERGSGPHWRPDGERIGYQIPGTASRSGKLELWSVRPDGGDPRLEYADSLCTGSNRYSFSWSPDGKQIAWLRSFDGESHQELIVRTLATGEERPLTHDRASMDEVCWTRQNDIVFSSNRGGHTNLWVISAAGGRAVQVTKDVGPDIGMRVSSDGKTILCMQQQPIRHVWIADLVGGVSHQATHDEANFSTVSLSPDRRRIVAVLSDPDVLQRAGEVIVMDRDGGDRRSIVGDDLNPLGVDWSPSDHLLAIAAAPKGLGADSAWVYLADPDSPAALRKLARGFGVFWVGDTALVVARSQTAALISARDGHDLLTGPDSSFFMVFANGSKLEYDARGGRQGYYWLAPGSALGDVGTRRLIAPLSIGFLDAPRSGDYLLYLDRAGAMMKLRLPSGAREIVHGTFNGMTRQSYGDLSWDGREFVYVEPGVSSRLLLYEHVK